MQDRKTPKGLLQNKVYRIEDVILGNNKTKRKNYSVITPKLTLIGAGPGDPDLLTIKGAKALAEANVVLYDALINIQLLEYAPKAAIKIFVGKRKGNHSYSQDEINNLIVENAFLHGHVVRLKGGDPFIFGRGSEEIDHADAFGLECEVVPGISSSIAVPAYQGISLTKRKVSESFWVVTGTTSARKLSKDIALAAQSSATVVILMGMSKLSKIIEIFQHNDKGDTAIAIIQNGTMINENIGVGTIDSIQDVVARKGLSNPAIIVIGDVVKHSHKLRAFYETSMTENLITQEDDYMDATCDK